MRRCQGIAGGLFLLAISGMVILQSAQERSDKDKHDDQKKQEVRQRLVAISLNPHGTVFYTEKQKSELRQFLHDNADAVLAIATEEVDVLFRQRSASTEECRLLLPCMVWMIKADRERGLAFNLDLFKKIQLALLIIEPYFLNKPKETRELIGKVDSGYVFGLITLRSDIVHYFSEAKSDLLVDHVKPLIENELGTMTNALQYLILFVEKDKALKDFLKQKFQDPKSKAYNHPLLKNLDEKRE